MKYLKNIKQGLCLVVVLCAGCSSGSDYSAGPVVSPQPAPTSVDYTTFVQAQYVALPGANETSVPVDVESTQFTFADQDNPTAFDATIASSP